MKFFTVIIFLFSSYLLFSQNLDSAKVNARQIIDLFIAQKYAEVDSKCDAEMKRKAGVSLLEDIWVGLQMKYDSLAEIGETRTSFKNEFMKTITVLKFGVKKIGLQITLNKQYQISGIFIVPPEEHYQPAEYLDAEQFTERKIEFGKAEFKNEGVLSLPRVNNKKVPVIIIVHGSGAIDKDLSIGPNKIYKDLAWGIAAKGVAVFRYDKRTFLYKDKILANNKSGKENYDVRNEYFEDLKDAISALSQRSEIDASKIFIIGHSEGGYLIPLINKNFKQVAGFISMAGTLREIPELALEQMDYLAPKESLDEKTLMKLNIEKQKVSNSLSKNINKKMSDDSVFAFPVNYWLYLKSYDTKSMAKKIEKPIYVLQGERDYQVLMKDYHIWVEVMKDKPNVNYKSYPQLNHLFLEGTGKSTPAEYTVPTNVPEYVIDDIANWVKVQSKK